MANVIKPETREKIEQLFREGNSIRETSRISGAAKITVKRVFKAMPDHESLKCKCGLDIRHKGRCAVRREAGKAQMPEPEKEKKSARHKIGHKKVPVSAKQDGIVDRLLSQYDEHITMAVQIMTCLGMLKEFGVEFKMPDRHVVGVK